MNPWNEPEPGHDQKKQESVQAESKDAGKQESGQSEGVESQSSDPAKTKSPAKEWKLIEKVVMSHSRELRSTRRWGILFKSLTFIYLFVILYMVWDATGDIDAVATGGHTAVVQVRGAIADGEEASADNIVSGLRAAYKHADTRAVILRINSPGGSPVQSGYVYDEINRLKQLNPNIPLVAVISDSGASGAYYIAAAADEIYANRASLVGSIGVTAASFGFSDAIDKLGIERRQFTSGEHKAFLDPFLPVDPQEKALFETLLNNVHQQFIHAVKTGRGDRLADNDDIFSGLFWTGEQALELGLIDGLKSTSQTARELGYPELIDFTPSRSAWEQFARELGIGMGARVTNILLGGATLR